MKEIVEGAYLIEGLRGANAFLLTSDVGLALVDSGMPGQADEIVAQIEEAGFALAAVRTIVVTHAHSDHTGNLAEMVRRTGAEVVAHQAEVPYLDGSESLPSGSFLQRLLNSLANSLSRLEPCLEVRALSDGELLPALGGLEVVHAPGHTPGCIALWQPERGILFTGDVLFHNGDKVTPPPKMYSVDPDGALVSARKVAALPVDVAIFSHGEPIMGDAQAALQAAVGG